MSGNAAADVELAALAGSGRTTGRLPALVAAKRDIAAKIVQVRRTDGDAAARALMLTDGDKAIMDEVRTTVAAVQRAARTRMAKADRREAVRAPLVFGLAALASLLGFLVIAWVAWRRRRAERMVQSLLTGVMDNAPIGLGFLDPGLKFAT